MGNEAGIIVAGKNGDDGYILSDDSVQGSPLTWATAAVTAYYKYKADRIIAESNQGGEMVAQVIGQVDPKVPVTLVHASRGKQTRAEPIAAQYEQGRVHHVGVFKLLEDELCLWLPGDSSPNRLDALVWALTELMLGSFPGLFFAGTSITPKAEEHKAERQVGEIIAYRDHAIKGGGKREEATQRWLRGD